MPFRQPAYGLLERFLYLLFSYLGLTVCPLRSFYLK